MEFETTNHERKLSTALAREAPLPEEREYSITSAEHKALGFRLRVFPSGAKSWIQVKKLHGELVTVTIGKLAGTGKDRRGLTMEQALRIAQDNLALLAKGINPNKEKRRQAELVAHEAAKQAVTVEIAFEEYLTVWQKKAAEGRRGGSEKTRDGLLQARRLLESGPVWKMPILELTGEVLDAEYSRLLDLATRGSGLTQATNTFRWLRAAVLEAAGQKDRRWQIAAFDELGEIRKDWNEGRVKTTIVGQAHGDLKKWWQAVESLRSRAMYPESAVATADLLVLTILFGNRMSELLTCRWEKVDFERRLITLYSSKATKNRKDHVLPFGRYAHAILRRRWDAYKELPAERQSGYIFWSERAGRDGSYSHLREPKKGVRQVAADSGIDAGLHDLRRSVGSLLTELGVPEQMLKKILNHAPGSVADAHYVVLRLEPYRAVFQRLEDKVLEEAGVQQLPPDQFAGAATPEASLHETIKALAGEVVKLTAATHPSSSSGLGAAPPPPSPGEPPARVDLSAYDITYRKSGDTYIVSTQINGKIVKAEGDTLPAARSLLAELLAG